MMVAPDLPPNHGTVVVDLAEGRFVVDASILHVEPLPVREAEDSVIEHGAWGVHGHWLGDKLAIRWRALHVEAPIDCRIDEWPVPRERFRAQHEATRSWSPFNFELTITTVRDESRTGVASGRVVRLDGDGGRTETPLRDRVAFLVDELGIGEAIASRIPDDVETPPPPGSRTAAGAGR
jgi:N-hydroxyarylamine O-acetyltransferase